MTLLFLLTLACIPKKDLEALQGKFDATQTELNETIAARDAKVTSLEEELAAEKNTVADLEKQIASLNRKIEALNGEKAALVSDRSRLRASVEEMEQALNELTARKLSAEQRVQQYQDLLDRFEKLIDAGQLKVQIADGRMVLALATDILFGSGSAQLSEEGAEALKEVSQVLTDIPERQFQVEGHTDNVPIQTKQYPSNWELASARATVVTKTMIEGGLEPARLSAASYASYKPIASNDSPEGRAQNRRIEIVVVPDLSELPGFDELNQFADGSEGDPE